MALPNKLISQFARMLKPESKKNSEETLYGTIVQQGNTKFVRIDGSEYLSPIATTVEMLPGERVTVMIKNHSAVVTGNITSPAARTGDVSAIADTVDKRTNQNALADLVYPVGSIYMSVSDVKPEVIFGGKWERIQDAFLYGAGTYAVGSTGGEKSHTLTVEEMPSHNHRVTAINQTTTASDAGWRPVGNLGYSSWAQATTGDTVSSTGGGLPHNNMPPYLVVNIWKRIE